MSKYQWRMLIVLLRSIGEFVIIGLAPENEKLETLDAWRTSCALAEDSK